MKRVLGGYLRGRLTGQIIGLLLALTGLMQLLELLEITTDVLDRGLGIAGIARYAVLRLPSELVVALPLAGLLGSMSAFYAMARTGEITALRSAGVGLWRVLGYLVPVPLLFAMLHLGLTQFLVPKSEANLRSWWDSTVPLEKQPAKPQWVHTNNGVVLFERSSADGLRLLGLRIYTRDANGLLAMRTKAETANWNGSAWLLTGTQDLRAAPGPVLPPNTARQIWESNLRPDDVVQLGAADPHLSGTALADVLVGDRVSTRPDSYYRTVLARSFTAPLTVLIMMLLAFPAAIVSSRGGGGGRLLVALALGLSFLLVDGALSAFGTSGRISPLWSALAAPMLFFLLGMIQLRSCEAAR
jgi:lipopolysaccharide export system permease protein